MTRVKEIDVVYPNKTQDLVRDSHLYLCNTLEVPGLKHEKRVTVNLCYKNYQDRMVLPCYLPLTVRVKGGELLGGVGEYHWNILIGVLDVI